MDHTRSYNNEDVTLVTIAKASAYGQAKKPSPEVDLLIKDLHNQPEGVGLT